MQHLDSPQSPSGETTSENYTLILRELLVKRVVTSNQAGDEFLSKLEQQEDREHRLNAAVEIAKLAVYLKELELLKDLREKQLHAAAMAQMGQSVGEAN